MACNCACATLRHAYLGVGNVLGGPPASPSVYPSVHPVKSVDLRACSTIAANAREPQCAPVSSQLVLDLVCLQQPLTEVGELDAAQPRSN